MIVVVMFSKVANAFRLSVGIALLALMVGAVAQVKVTTWHNDNLRTGLNSAETILTTGNVNSTTFGLLFSLPSLIRFTLSLSICKA